MNGLEPIFTLKSTTDDEFEASIPGAWGQGRSVYGGISGAVTLRAAKMAFGRPVRSLSLNFVGPVEPGKLSIVTRRLRQGRSTTHALVELSQNDAVASSSLLVLGDARPTGVTFDGPAPPTLLSINDARDVPYVAGVTPEVTQHFEYRWTTDNFPFSGGEPHVQGYIRPRVVVTSGPELVAALLDAWPPPVWSIIDVPSPGSSVSWFVSFQPAAYRTDIPGDAWWIFDARLQSSHDGYAHFEANLWNCDGEHVAISRQIFAEFSGKN